MRKERIEKRETRRKSEKVLGTGRENLKRKECVRIIHGKRRRKS